MENKYKRASLKY